MLFNLTHILYMAISGLISVGLLIIFAFKVKEKKYQLLILKITAIITVVIHFSSLWVDFFKTGSAIVQDPMLLPIYPCNVLMWLLLITAFVKKREGVGFRILSEFTAIAGVVCGVLGIVLNENYASTPTLLDYEVLKGLLSHSTMVFGCLYLFVIKEVKIRVFNTISVACGMTLFLVDGLIINGLYKIFNLDPCNSMYLIETPFAQLPWLNTLVIGLFAVVLMFIISALYEMLALKSDERWYSKMQDKRRKA